MIIRDATEADLPALLELHNFAVHNLDATWTEVEETLEDRRKWFKGRKAEGFPIVVAVDAAGEVLGYGSYGTFRGRDGYRDTVEHSVYLFPRAQGQGTGKALLSWLIAHARQAGRHVMIAAIDSSNAISIAMHEKAGFVSWGALPQVGQKHGKWLSLALLGLVLDDRERP